MECWDIILLVMLELLAEGRAKFWESPVVVICESVCCSVIVCCTYCHGIQ